MTRYFYDCEFLEDGKTVDLISIGIVADDGREFYAVNEMVSEDPLWSRITKHRWLMANVVPHLPLWRLIPDSRKVDQPVGRFRGNFNLDIDDPAVMHPARIAERVEQFIAAGSPDRERNELWAYYGAYDHVALCQLYGTMMDLPACIPMWTHDLMQFAGPGVDLSSRPQSDEHHALADARWTWEQYLWIKRESVAR